MMDWISEKWQIISGSILALWAVYGLHRKSKQAEREKKEKDLASEVERHRVLHQDMEKRIRFIEAHTIQRDEFNAATTALRSDVREEVLLSKRDILSRIDQLVHVFRSENNK